MFSPYVESWLLDRFDVKGYPGDFVTLAFLLSDSAATLRLDGTMPVGAFKDVLARSGKGVVLSFGGAAGTELAERVTDVRELAKRYVAVAKTYDAVRLDFDIEGAGLRLTDVIARRNAALKRVRASLPRVAIQYTLPVMPHGLAQDALDVLKDAKRQGVAVDVVNVMTMNYGDSYVGDMGAYAIEAAQATRAQIRAAGLKDAAVGITPMILQNDVRANVFTLADARKVAEFARKNKSWVRFVSFWAAGRDVGAKFGRVFAAL